MPFYKYKMCNKVVIRSNQWCLCFLLGGHWWWTCTESHDQQQGIRSVWLAEHHFAPWPLIGQRAEPFPMQGKHLCGSWHRRTERGLTPGFSQKKTCTCLIALRLGTNEFRLIKGVNQHALCCHRLFPIPSPLHLSIFEHFWEACRLLRKLKALLNSLSLERTHMISPFCPKPFIAGPSQFRAWSNEITSES